MKVLDTALNYLEETGDSFAAGKLIEVEGRSVVVLKEPTK
jgi:hypothetical protein